MINAKHPNPPAEIMYTKIGPKMFTAETLN